MQGDGRGYGRLLLSLIPGTQSNNYHQFRNYSFIAYNSLRKNANLILNLFSLMVRVRLPLTRTIGSIYHSWYSHGAREGSAKGARSIEVGYDGWRGHSLSFLPNQWEYSRLVQWWTTLLFLAYFPQLVEQIHRVAQYFKTWHWWLLSVKLSLVLTIQSNIHCSSTEEKEAKYHVVREVFLWSLSSDWIFS